VLLVLFADWQFSGLFIKLPTLTHFAIYKNADQRSQSTDYCSQSNGAASYESEPNPPDDGSYCDHEAHHKPGLLAENVRAYNLSFNVLPMFLLIFCHFENPISSARKDSVVHL